MLFSTALFNLLPVLVAAVPVLIESDILVDVLETRATSATKSNDVDNGVCAPVTLIFARGSFEPTNMGIIIGPKLVTALNAAFGTANVAAQGVNYAANLGGNFDQTGNNAGIALMVAEVNKAIAQCPKTQIILSGYSQGGLVTHGTLNTISASAAKYVKAVVLFGDEGFQQKITSVPASSVDSFCANGDDICEKDNFVITPAHLSYGNDATAAAAFCKSKITIK